ncbi:hypothetical protein FB45DRAFT_991878 [Roridomyces roridus]|uniref:Uncharacterized protein n=1 Tax=Roridomyces roridus TaxID=1738132 RepID=A0AAD7FJ72_9AGAR|nr:hypothetical protein FB45DRAFT_991878 [Roridomyces roridus]
MDSLPIDMSHPAVRDYLALVRLQVLTPLSLLINIATTMVCTLALNPSLRTIAKLYPTPISPKPAVISVYVALMYLGQIGYCVLLVLARKPETKRTLTKGVGLSLVFANWVMAFWAVAWVFEWFLAATILQGLLLILLLYSNIALLTYHAPTTSRPLDMALIHAPLRFFFVLQFALMFPVTLFVNLGLTHTPTYEGVPADYQAYAWPAFGVVLGTNLVSLLFVALRRDIVWCVASTWICVSMWTLRPKPQVVYITVIIFTILHPLALLASYIHAYFYSKRTVEEGAVALPGDDHPGLDQSRPSTEAQVRGPREVDPQNVWGSS